MVLAPQAVTHPDGMSPLEPVEAWNMYGQERYSLTKVVAEDVNIKGEMLGRDESMAEVGAGTQVGHGGRP